MEHHWTDLVEEYQRLKAENAYLKEELVKYSIHTKPNVMDLPHHMESIQLPLIGGFNARFTDNNYHVVGRIRDKDDSLIHLAYYAHKGNPAPYVDSLLTYQLGSLHLQIINAIAKHAQIEPPKDLPEIYPQPFGGGRRSNRCPHCKRILEPSLPLRIDPPKLEIKESIREVEY